MGFLSKLFGSKDTGPYKSEAEFVRIRAKQAEASPQIVAVLREHGVTADSHLRLEFFFYTNTDEKAANLSTTLNAMDYSSNYGEAPGVKNAYLVNGWTTPLKMDERSVLEWTAQMCDIGAEHDCEFDGWGTDPTQEQTA